MKREYFNGFITDPAPGAARPPRERGDPKVHDLAEMKM